MQDQRFNSFKTFIYMGRELAEINPMFAYYAKTHGTQIAHSLYKKLDYKDPQYKILQQSIEQWLQEIEKIKQTNKLLFVSKDENYQQIQDFITQIFFDADDRERSGEISIGLAKQFFVCAKFIEILESFSGLNDLIIERKQESIVNSRHSRYIRNQMKKSEQVDIYVIKVKFDDDDSPNLDNPIISKNINKMTQSVQLPSSRSDQIKAPFVQQMLNTVVPLQLYPQDNKNTSHIQKQVNIYVPQKSPQELPDQQQINLNLQRQGIIMQYQKPGENQQGFFPQQQTKFQEQSNYFQTSDLHEKIKFYTKDAISELDFKKYSAAKNDILKALNYIDSITKGQ